MLPKLTTCFKKVTQIQLAVHYSCNKHGRDKTDKITMEVWCTEQNITSITDVVRGRCSSTISLHTSQLMRLFSLLFRVISETFEA